MADQEFEMTLPYENQSSNTNHHPQKKLPGIGQLLPANFWVECWDIWEGCNSKFAVIFWGCEIANTTLLIVIKLEAAIAETENKEDLFMIKP